MHFIKFLCNMKPTKMGSIDVLNIVAWWLMAWPPHSWTCSYALGLLRSLIFHLMNWFSHGTSLWDLITLVGTYFSITSVIQALKRCQLSWIIWLYGSNFLQNSAITDRIQLQNIFLFCNLCFSKLVSTSKLIASWSDIRSIVNILFITLGCDAKTTSNMWFPLVHS